MTLDGIKRDLRARRDLTALYARALGKWLLLAAAAGISCGLVGTAFHMAVESLTRSTRGAASLSCWSPPSSWGRC